MFAVVGSCRLGRLALPLRARMWAVWILGATLCLVSPATAFGQTTSPTTIWSFLGVPNPFGLNAADQQSANPAIQAAAKAKAAKHEICKKKKAIAYLAGLGCTPEHPEVGPALIAAMSDPDEPVRYEAVKAVLQTAGACQSAEQKREAKKAQSHSDRWHDLKKKIDKAFCDCIDRLCGKAPPKEHKHKNEFAKLFGWEKCDDPCKKDCDSAAGLGSCCSPEMQEKLWKLAYERDEHGCFLERSQRVRDMAEQAIKACNACSGCGDCGPCSAGSSEYANREMPPNDAREQSPVDTYGDCVHDTAIVPLPPVVAHPETAPAQEPTRDPLALPPPAPEPIPLPPSVLVPNRSSARIASLPPPSCLPRLGGEPVPDIVASAPPRQAVRSSIWNPADPLQVFDSTGSDEKPGFPTHPRPSRLELARTMAGTAVVAPQPAPRPTPPALAPPRQAVPSSIWNQADPRRVFDSVGGDADPGFRTHPRPSRLELARRMTGTAVVAQEAAARPTPPATSPPQAPFVAAAVVTGGSATSTGLRGVALVATALLIAELIRTVILRTRRRQTS